MPAYFDGTEVDAITMDGTALGNLIIDGTEVWKKVSPGDVIDGLVVASVMDGVAILLAPVQYRVSNIEWGLRGIAVPELSSTPFYGPDPYTGTYNTNILVSSTYNNQVDVVGTTGAPAAEHCRSVGAYDLPNYQEARSIYANRVAIDAGDPQVSSGSTIGSLAEISQRSNYNNKVRMSSIGNSSDRAGYVDLANGGHGTGLLRSVPTSVIPIKRVSL